MGEAGSNRRSPIKEARYQPSCPPARSRSSRVCPVPGVEGSTHMRAALGAFWSRIGSLVSVPTMLSMPLAYPSTLDRRLGARCPTRRGVGARRSPSVTPKLQAKVTRTYTCESGDTSWRTFLSRAGPQVRLELFKLSITFWLEVVDFALQKRKRRPIGSPLPAVVFTLELASTPRGKGESAAVLALLIGAMPARLDRRRRRRFGKEVEFVAEV
jgi:hypothetical protein